MIVLIGSTAAEHWLGRGILGRLCSDVDLITTADQCKKLEDSAKEAGQLVLVKHTHEGQKCLMVISDSKGNDTSFDIEIADPGEDTSSGMILKLAAEIGQSWPQLSLPGGSLVSVAEGDERAASQCYSTASVAPLSLLRTVKRSHILFPVDWRKHICDYHILKAASEKPASGGNFQGLKTPSAGNPCSLSPSVLEEILKLRQAEGQVRYGASRVKLNVSNEEFFKVWYLKEMVLPEHLRLGLNPGTNLDIYTHDELHEIVKYYNRPIYTTLKQDPAKARLEKSLFVELTHKDQLRLVREEAMAIGMERVLVPQVLAAAAAAAVASRRPNKRSNDKRIKKLGGQQDAVPLPPAPDVQEAYTVGLSMVLTTLSKGWFRTFGLEHWPELCTCDCDLLKLLVDDGRLVIPTFATDTTALAMPTGHTGADGTASGGVNDCGGISTTQAARTSSSPSKRSYTDTTKGGGASLNLQRRALQ
jgi:hypothetical protein